MFKNKFKDDDFHINYNSNINDYLISEDIIKNKTEEILPEVLNFDTESRHLFHASLAFAMWTRLQGQKLNNDQIAKAMLRQCILIANDNR